MDNNEARWYEQIRQIMWGRENFEEWLTVCCAKEITQSEFERISEMLLESKMIVVYFVFMTRHFENLDTPEIVTELLEKYIFNSDMSGT